MPNLQAMKTAAAPKKSELKRAGRRTLIREAALHLFSERGYDRTSLQDIADTLGLTHPALYYYYRSKSDLLFDAIKMVMETMLADLETSIGNANLDHTEKLSRLIEKQINIQFSTQDAIRLIDSVLFGAMSRTDIFDKEQSRTLLKMQRKTVGLYKNLLKEGALSGAFKMDDETVATFAILGAVSNVPYWFKPHGTLSKQGAAKKLAHFILKSLV